MTTIESDHQRILLTLQNQLQTSKQEIEQLKLRLESIRQNNVETEKESQLFTSVHELSKDESQWNSTERQQGEVKQQSRNVRSIPLYFSPLFRVQNRRIQPIKCRSMSLQKR